eukprot:NODE_10460_length_334_cov_38147.614035_g9548_i0.p3 GENE.NODE_10460_length_334_cov_38147.614035_g9548_i0~~NODE_10460_length_334_cov_38147.614035_g9548_i0.p3  ORF type:complete len:107 (-),score=41.01 NODE_10460_length_334_cov_38147.614035_g9548_i0:13-300(-)
MGTTYSFKFKHIAKNIMDLQQYDEEVDLCAVGAGVVGKAITAGTLVAAPAITLGIHQCMKKCVSNNKWKGEKEAREYCSKKVCPSKPGGIGPAVG